MSISSNVLFFIADVLQMELRGYASGDQYTVSGDKILTIPCGEDSIELLVEVMTGFLNKQRDEAGVLVSVHSGDLLLAVGVSRATGITLALVNDREAMDIEVHLTNATTCESFFGLLRGAIVKAWETSVQQTDWKECTNKLKKPGNDPKKKEKPKKTKQHKSA